MITIENLHKRYHDTEVLKNINITIDDGDIYGLIGRSGAGKSTLLRCINGLETFQSGSIVIDGVDITTLQDKSLRELRKNIGMIFQGFSLIDRKTVYENIAIPLECWHIPKPEQKERIEKLLKIVGLESKRDQKARDLSGGQKQRVAIARAMVMNPKILLCDEATSALDPKTTDEILELLLQLNKEYGITIIMVTHQMSVIHRMCTKMSILENGHCMVSGDVKEVFLEQPEALQNLVGILECNLPETGINIEILITDEAVGQQFHSDLSLSLKKPYKLINSSLTHYREGVLSAFVMNISEECLEEFLAYFDAQHLSYKRIERG
ncbi:methionine ABC transporter ATP-binding protein [Sulfurospirillum halorespirans]|nr:ATP-binding cassette domain-containing protein [Sulfurospirillum halorespirans]